MNKTSPKYKKGDRLVLMDQDPDFTIPHDDNMTVNGEPSWYPYENHPEGGYWQYPIKGKANECPEDFLTPYVKGQEHYTVELPCHRYFNQRKSKK